MPGDARPIGIFDSGVGGLTVYRALRARLPQESFVYLGDTARIPYGTRSPETVCAYARQDAAFLLACGVKLIVIACNTASSVALDLLQANSPVPVVGVIEPGARQAAAVTRCGHIGVIGTEATMASAAYPRAIRRIAPAVRVTSQSCPLFVPLVEEGWAQHPVTATVAAEYLTPLREAEVDTLVLGCTHYPVLEDVIRRVMGKASPLWIQAPAPPKKSWLCWSRTPVLHRPETFRRQRAFASRMPVSVSAAWQRCVWARK
ncbi:glutamate racemase [Chloracidobacterium aggregatum]|uniref:glutamate racemase n=1 Tax=Chloracidobacterium aggregatum TaxID=2851959 RepID=UPI00387E9F2E